MRNEGFCVRSLPENVELNPQAGGRRRDLNGSLGPGFWIPLLMVGQMLAQRTESSPQARNALPTRLCRTEVCALLLMYPSNSFVKALCPLTHFKLTSEVFIET